MTKNRCKSFKSFSRNHIDPEKDDELRGANAEIEANVQQIVAYIKEEEKDGNKSVAKLMEDFYNRYQSLYKSYDHLTEELKKQAHDKNGRDSSSSSSDSSDSEDSPKKKGKKNSNAKNSIKRELQMSLLEVGDLKSKLTVTVDEKESLYFEYQSSLSKAQEAQRIIMDLKAEAERWNDEKSKLLIENDGLTLELENVRKLHTEQNETLKLAEHEISKLTQMQTTGKKENVYLSSKILQLEDEKQQAEIKIQDLMNESIQFSQKLAGKERELSSHLKMHEAQKEEQSSRMEHLELEVSELQEEKIGLQTRISEMDRTLIEKEKELYTLQKKSDDKVNEASIQITALAAQLNQLQEQLDSLSAQKIEADLIVEKNRKDISEFLIQIGRLKEELRNCEQNLTLSEKKIEEVTEQFHVDIHVKNQEVDQLEENMEDLKTELEMKMDEMSTLVENMRTTEVKQRLTSQKLRLTEQLLSETEESHLRKIVKLQEEQKLLEERIGTMSGIIATYKEACVKMMKEVSDKVKNTLTGFDTSSMKYEEDYGHLESRIYEIVNELKVTGNWIRESNAEKNQSKKSLEKLETVLRMGEDERKGLMQTVKEKEEKLGEMVKVIEERDEKMGELERQINEKDNGFLSLSEEKRDAIRQLCISIDYYRDCCEDLKDVISKTRGGRWQISA